MKNLKRSTVRGVFWAYASRYSGKLLVFVSTLILARLLTQQDFGVAGYALVVIAFMDTLGGLGVGAALIYYKDEPAARDTAFMMTFVAAGALMLLTWFAAPLVAAFFQDPRAISVIRLLSLSLPLSALGNTHFALLEKHLQFGRKFIPDLANAVVKGLSAIILAYKGFGVWSLILAQLAGTTASVVCVWIVMPWRPSFVFDRQLATAQLSFGGKIIVIGLLGFFVNNLGYFLVGRVMGAAVLGVYVLALRIPRILIQDTAVVLGNVMFPVFSIIRDDPKALASSYLMSFRYISLFAMPLGLGLSAVSEPFVITFLTSRWEEMIPVLRLIAVYMLFLSLSFNSGTVYKAIGRPGLSIGLSVLRLAILLPALIWAAHGPATLEAVAWVQLGVVTIHLILNLFIILRILGISVVRFLPAIVPAAVAGGIMYLAVSASITFLRDATPLLQLVVSTMIGGLIYCGLIWQWQHEFIKSGYRQMRSAMATRK